MSVTTRHGWVFSVKEVMVGTLLFTVIAWAFVFESSGKTGMTLVGTFFQDGFIACALFSVFAFGAPALFFHHLFNYKKLRREETKEELMYRLEENQRQQSEYPSKLKKEAEELRAELENL